MGYRCLQVPDSAAFHVGSDTTGWQDSDFAIYHGHRNTVRAFVKNMPGDCSGYCCRCTWH